MAKVTINDALSWQPGEPHSHCAALCGPDSNMVLFLDLLSLRTNSDGHVAYWGAKRVKLKFTWCDNMRRITAEQFHSYWPPAFWESDDAPIQREARKHDTGCEIPTCILLHRKATRVTPGFFSHQARRSLKYVTFRENLEGVKHLDSSNNSRSSVSKEERSTGKIFLWIWGLRNLTSMTLIYV